MTVGRIVDDRASEPFERSLFIAVVYWIWTSSMSRRARRMERRLVQPEGG